MLRGIAAAYDQLAATRITVSDVIAHAGVSRRTFYEIFQDREECLIAALHEALRRASERVIGEYEAQNTWRAAVRAGVQALLAFLDDDRTLGRLLIVHSLAAGPRVLAWRAEIIETVAEAIEFDARAPRAAKKPLLGASSVVAGALAALHARLTAQPDVRALPLAGELTAMVLLPYLGPAAAAREAERKPAPRSRSRISGDHRDLLAASRVRLTYRTVRVLAAIAELDGSDDRRHGSSNRKVAEAAGIADQGQVSKMLARLAATGLIENRRRNATERGEPNAWRLTAEGMQVRRAVADSGQLRDRAAGRARPNPAAEA